VVLWAKDGEDVDVIGVQQLQLLSHIIHDDLPPLERRLLSHLSEEKESNSSIAEGSKHAENRTKLYLFSISHPLYT